MFENIIFSKMNKQTTVVIKLMNIENNDLKIIWILKHDNIFSLKGIFSFNYSNFCADSTRNFYFIITVQKNLLNEDYTFT